MSKFMNALKLGKKYESDEATIKNIPLSEIATDKQVRFHFDEEKLKELSDSIREHGIQNPIHVRVVGDKYVVLTGERRFRASQKLKLENVPCIVHENQLSEKEIQALQLIENIQRHDLSGIELAKGFDALGQNGLDAEKIAKTLGISRTTVSKGNVILKQLNGEWIDELEKQHVSIHELYKVAKEKNYEKKINLYKTLMKKHNVEVRITQPNKKKKVSTKFTEEQWNIIWEYLKTTTRRDKNLLSKYITPKKAQTILDLTTKEK